MAIGEVGQGQKHTRTAAGVIKKNRGSARRSEAQPRAVTMHCSCRAHDGEFWTSRDRLAWVAGSEDRCPIVDLGRVLAAHVLQRSEYSISIDP